MIFNDDGTGIGGDICNLNFEDSIINFNWSLNGTTLEIIFLSSLYPNKKIKFFLSIMDCYLMKSLYMLGRYPNGGLKLRNLNIKIG